MTELVPLKAITLDVELQPRDEIDKALVGEYAALLADGVEFPPVVAYRNGDATLLLEDGWHRFYAHEREKREVIAVDIRDGDRLTAIRASLAANATTADHAACRPWRVLTAWPSSTASSTRRT